MNDDLDVIPMPGQPGKYARRVFVEAWQAAGSPPVNSAGRLKSEQQYFYDGWVSRKPGFNPADNPNDPTQALAHVRFVAADIDPTPERVARLSAAGLVRPYAYEEWHWQLPGDVRRFELVTEIPTTADNGSSQPFEPEEYEMFTIYRCGARIMIVGAGSVMELGTTLSKQTGVDGTETLTTFQAAGAKIVDLTTRQYDVLRINVRAGRAVA